MARLSLYGRRKIKTANQQPVPTWWVGSIPEWQVYSALLKLGYKDRFTYQSSQLGGRQSRGGAVIDFLIPELNLGINVQSKYFHYSTTRKQVANIMQKAQLEGQGIRMVFVNEDDVLRDAVFYVQEALEGREH